MIAVWIIAIAFAGVGLFLCIPRYYKIFSCRRVTTGTLLTSRSSGGHESSSAIAEYEYYVDGIRYTGNTGWTNYGVFRAGQECQVRYNPNKPEQSFVPRTGMLLNCILGTLFFFLGIAAFIVGILLTIILG